MWIEQRKSMHRNYFSIPANILQLLAKSWPWDTPESVKVACVAVHLEFQIWYKKSLISNSLDQKNANKKSEFLWKYARSFYLSHICICPMYVSSVTFPSHLNVHINMKRSLTIAHTEVKKLNTFTMLHTQIVLKICGGMIV